MKKIRFLILLFVCSYLAGCSQPLDRKFDESITNNLTADFILSFDLRNKGKPFAGITVNETTVPLTPSLQLISLPFQTQKHHRDKSVLLLLDDVNTCCTFVTYPLDTSPLSFSLGFQPNFHSSVDAQSIFESGVISRTIDELKDSSRSLFLLKNNSERLFFYKYPDGSLFNANDEFQKSKSQYENFIPSVSPDLIAIALPNGIESKEVIANRNSIPDYQNGPDLGSGEGVVRVYPGQASLASSDYIAFRYLLPVTKRQEKFVDAVLKLFFAILVPVASLLIFDPNSVPNSLKKPTRWILIAYVVIIIVIFGYLTIIGFTNRGLDLDVLLQIIVGFLAAIITIWIALLKRFSIT